MKKILLVTILLFQSIFGFGAVATQLYAAGLSDTDDIFTISSPAPDSIVNGQTPISIRAYDDDQESISFFAKLFDRETCYENQIGRVTDESQLQSKQNQNSVVDWNTFETSSKSSIEDGSYCLQICVFLKNGETPYSACNSRVVEIANNNTRPEFIDFPEKIEANEGEEFSFQFKSEDSDGDSIKYRIKSGPESISIDENTGLLTGIVENISESSDYETTVQITDSRGVSNEKTFIISIRDSETGGEEEEQNVNVTLNIVSPAENFVQTNKFLKVEWETENSDTIQNYKIEISQNLSEWQTLAEEISTNQQYYLVDVSEFSDGEYYIRVTAVLSGEQEVSSVSNKFNIAVKADTETEVENTIQIFEVSPGDGSVVLLSNFAQITGKFVPGEGSTVDVDSFEIMLDGKVLEGCEVTTEEFICAVEQIEIGMHALEVTILDVEEKESSLDWTFEIVEEFPENQPVEETENEFVILGQTISESLLIFILLICCIGAVLILTPWLLYYLWSRDTAKKEKVISEVEFESTPRQPLVETYTPPVEDRTTIYETPEPAQNNVTVVPMGYVENPPEANSYYSVQPIELGKEKQPSEQTTTNNYSTTNNYDSSTYSPVEDYSEVYTNAGSTPQSEISQNYNPTDQAEESKNQNLIEPYTQNQFEEAQKGNQNSSSQPYLLPNTNDSLAKDQNVSATQVENNNTDEFGQVWTEADTNANTTTSDPQNSNATSGVDSSYESIYGSQNNNPASGLYGAADVQQSSNTSNQNMGNKSVNPTNNQNNNEEYTEPPISNENK